MRGFILGVIVTLLVIFCGAYFYATTGHFDTRAVPNSPGSFERKLANQSLDEWVDEHAPKKDNPFQPTMENIMDGSMTYDKNCALCHGSLKQTESPMHRKFYPPECLLPKSSMPALPSGSRRALLRCVCARTRVAAGYQAPGITGWHGLAAPRIRTPPETAPAQMLLALDQARSPTRMV